MKFARESCMAPGLAGPIAAPRARASRNQASPDSGVIGRRTTGEAFSQRPATERCQRTAQQFGISRVPGATAVSHMELRPPLDAGRGQ